jgi:hypothetical protein
MFGVFGRVIGIDQDIIQIYDDTHVQEIGENIVHESLESRRCVGKSKGHYTPFEQTIAGSESRFPLVAFPDADQMIGIPEIDF